MRKMVPTYLQMKKDDPDRFDAWLEWRTSEEMPTVSQLAQDAAYDLEKSSSQSTVKLYMRKLQEAIS